MRATRERVHRGLMSTQPSPELLSLQETLAGRYSLERELGRGGMGIVYLAHEIRLDRPVALKVLPREYAVRAELRERFLREARTAARLSHPHIIPIHAVHEIGDVVFFAMAYVEGETLGERIRSRGPLHPREATRILREIGWALAYAHGQGVVHRDVKPDNILLEAGTGRALVTDFGIAHAGAEPRAADEDALLGTAEFMSPEQVRGATADARSDLYSLGVVGYYMLSGRLPLQGPTQSATLAKHLAEPAAPLATVVPGLPGPLTQVIDRCLTKDPTARFADGEALAEALGESLRATSEVPLALRLFMKQSRESTASTAAMEFVSIVGLGFGLAGLVSGAPFVPVVCTLVGSGILALTPVTVVVRMVRRLLRAGYSHDDLVRATQEEVDEGRAELASMYGREGDRLDRWLKRLLVGGLGTQLAALGWMMWGPYVPGVGLLTGLGVAGGLTFLAAGAVSAVRHQLEGQVPGQGWLRFWKSRIGRALFSIAGLKMDRRPAGAAYGPTVLAIGLAADRLYEALPADQRETFHELPDIVKRLEADAGTMRARIKEFDALLAEVRDGDASLPEEIQGAKAAAEERLREVVAALETIRVQLLRLHAGAGSIEGMTIDLSAAKELSEHVGRVLEGRRQAERLLGRPDAPELATSPTPA